MNLKNFFHPKSIAIVGASETEGKVGNAVAKNILKLGYAGEVFLVNPKHSRMFGRKCYAKLEELDESVDLAIVMVPARFVFDVVKNGSQRCKNFVVISAGFAETGAEGRAREQELLELAEAKNLNILGPNCLGFILPEINLNASFAGGMPEIGNIAFVTQSGALAVALMDIAKKEKMGFSHIVSVGNKMQLDETELIEYLIADKKTKVIGLYLEGIKNGKKFMEVVARASGVKPVVIIKAGKTEKAQKAISSHTGALAGSDDIMEKVFERLGIVRAENLENFIDLLKLISLSKAPKKNNKVAVLTNAGGPGVLTTDAFLGKKIELAEISPTAKKKLREFLPLEASVENPVDLLGDADEMRYEKALAVLEKEDIGSVVCVLTPQDQTPVAKIADKIIYFRNRTKKVVSTIFIGGERIQGALNNFRVNSIHNSPYPEQAVSALNKYYEWSRVHREKIKLSAFKPNQKRKRKAVEIIEAVRSTGRKALLFGEAQELMELYAINCVPYQNIKLGGLGQLDFPVVLKVDSDQVLHKADKQGIVLDIHDQTELADALKAMSASFPGEKFLIQPMQEIKTELIAGIKNDPIFGPVVVFGLGGIYTEVFKAVDFLVGPMDQDRIEAEIMRSKVAFLFAGARGQKPYDLKEFASILAKLMALAHENEAISELDINPLLVYNNKKEAVAVDVKILIK